ncbi:MAG: TraR/DksA C4-type zinc finger protein [Alphaproteobacteria bacterium]|nr:TraR/DksA C4-type zinc finger protein [Alphaproteobacteria bacterium]
MSDDADFDLPTFERLLREQRAELAALRAGSKDSRAPVTLDQQSVGRLSRMDALQGQAMALEQDRRREESIVRIDAALARIESGDFGYCLSCDEPISQRRLMLDPANPVCVDCASV